jgi:hypothetical protein
MAKSAKIIQRGEQVFDPETERVVSKLYGLTDQGEIGVVATTVITIDDFIFWYEVQTKTMEAVRRHLAEKHIRSLPKRQRRRTNNVIAMKTRG